MPASQEGTPVRCPTCGADCAPDARFCGTCGGPLDEPQPLDRAARAAGAASALPLAFAAALATDTPPVSDPLVAEPAAFAAREAAEYGAPRERPVAGTGAADTEGTVHCQWCGAVNPAGSARCGECGAAFPRPEQDAALLRASQERIRAAQDYIQTVQRKRRNWSLGRLFGR